MDHGNVIRKTGDTVNGTIIFNGTGAGIILNEYTTIAAPAEGQLGWDYAAHKLYIYSGAAWKLVTSAV